MAEPGSLAAPRSRPRCLPPGGRCCLAQVSARCSRVSAIGCLWELGAGPNALGGPGTLHPFLFHLTPSQGHWCGHPPLFRPSLSREVSFSFLFSIVGVKLARSRGSGPCEAGGQEGETGAQIDGNMETAELCGQTTLLHLSTCEAWPELLLGAGSKPGLPAPCGLGGWGRAQPRVGADSGLLEARKASLQFGETGRADAGTLSWSPAEEAGRSGGMCVCTAWGIGMA